MAVASVTHGILITTIFWLTASGARIEIVPVAVDGLVTTAVNISCTPNYVEKEAKEISVIQIVRGENNMASVRQGSGIVYGDDFTSVVEAEGHIDPDVRNSYLRMTMRHVIDANSGKYTCLVYFFNKRGFMVEEMDEGHLIVDDPDLKSHLKYLMQQKFLQDDLIKEQGLKLMVQQQLLNKLQTEIELKGSEPRNSPIKLEEIINNNTREIGLLSKKVHYKSAFTAGYRKSKTFNQGNQVIFDVIVMNEGPGYDKDTGLFTAPIKGIYSFHLTTATGNSGYKIDADIQVNNKTMARTDVYDVKDWEQSSTSCVVKLEPGDVVRVVIHYVNRNSIAMLNYPYTLFTGHLVTPLQ